MLPLLPNPVKYRHTDYAYVLSPQNALFIPQGTFIINVPEDRIHELVNNFAVLKLYDPSSKTWQDTNTAINTNSCEIKSIVTRASTYAVFEQVIDQKRQRKKNADKRHAGKDHGLLPPSRAKTSAFGGEYSLVPQYQKTAENSTSSWQVLPI